MDRRQDQTHSERQARGHQPLSARQTLREALRPLLAEAAIIDAPGFPEFDVAVPARAPETAAAGVACLRSHPLVAWAEIGAGAFINLRWSAQALDGTQQVLLDGARHLPHVEGVRAYRRCLDLEWMASNEEAGPPVTGDPSAGRVPVAAGPSAGGKGGMEVALRTLAVRLEWFAEVGERPPGKRMIRAIVDDVDALYGKFPLLRGTLAERATRRRLLAAAAASMRMAARLGWLRSGHP